MQTGFFSKIGLKWSRSEESRNRFFKKWLNKFSNTEAQTLSSEFKMCRTEGKTIIMMFFRNITGRIRNDRLKVSFPLSYQLEKMEILNLMSRGNLHRASQQYLESNAI